MARLKAKNMAGTTLTADITNTATSFGVVNASLLPDCPFRVTIYSPDPQVTAYEIVEVGAKDDVANTVSSVQRGLEGTTAIAHSAGAYVEVKWTAEMYNELETEAGAQAKADAVNNALLSHKNDNASHGLNIVNKNIADLQAYLGYTDNDVYGIEVDIPNNKITRIAGSIGKTAGVDFDNINAFKRKRCIVADDTTVLAYCGETGYTETGKTAVEITKGGTTYPVGTHVQVMVEQPKFYYKRVPLETESIIGGVGTHLRKWRDYICDYPIYDFKVHPCFVRDGREYNYIYYPAYEGSIYDVSAEAYLLADEQVADFNADKLCSIAGAKPASGATQNLNITNTRKIANNRGEGWQQMDVLAHYAEVMLMSIEYATFDFQTAIGRGVVDKASGSGNESVNTGATSNLGNASGMASGTNGLASVSYRGRENPWGNIWKWNDGLNIEAKNIHEAYWADSEFTSDIKTAPYKNCGFTLAKSSGYISAIGYTQNCDFMYIPSETLGASNKPLNDYFYQNHTYGGFLVARLGGGWYHGSSAGACFLTVSTASGYRYRTIGGCLLCVPQNNK
jgi:hypothetical protein